MKKFLLIFLPITCFIAIAYFSIAFYFRDKFYPGTFINDIYVTGLTIEEAKIAIAEEYKYPVVNISDGEHSFQLVLSDYAESCKFNIDSYIGYGLIWPAKLNIERINVLPKVIIDWDSASNEYYNSDIVLLEKESAKDVKIVKNDEGVELVSSLNHHLDVDAFFEKVKLSTENALIAGIDNVEIIAEEEDYIDLLPSKEQQNIIDKYEIIDKYLNNEIVYNLECKELVVDKASLISFVSDESGNIQFFDGKLEINENNIHRYVDEFCNEINTYGHEKEFVNHNGETKKIIYKDYGSLIDTEEEYTFLHGAITDCINGEYIPLHHALNYTFRKAYRGAYNLGDTFVEIDLENQVLLLKQNGEYVFQSDMVSGEVRRKRETPIGVYYIYYMERNRTLVGEDYRTPVNYWMAINKGVGIHDAYWRKAFGGDIYLTNGSHGCLNLPLEKAEELYGMVEVGIPAVVY